MLGLLGHELDNANQMLEDWMADYYHETMAAREKVEKWTTI